VRRKATKLSIAKSRELRKASSPFYRTLLAENFIFKVLTRLDHKVLGISNLKYILHFITICLLLVLNVFKKKID